MDVFKINIFDVQIYEIFINMDVSMSTKQENRPNCIKANKNQEIDVLQKTTSV